MTSSKFTLRCGPPIDAKSNRRMLWEIKAIVDRTVAVPWHCTHLSVDAQHTKHTHFNIGQLWARTGKLLHEAGLIRNLPSSGAYYFSRGVEGSQTITISYL